MPKTVLVEVEWVLRKGYGFDRAAVNQALTALVSLENLSVEDAPAIRRALGWHAVGLDLADAVHLASSARAERFVTFDTAFAATAEKVGTEPGVERL